MLSKAKHQWSPLENGAIDEGAPLILRFAQD